MVRPMSGTIAIVGRPNVGKSALFNRIVGRRIAIVHDQPGVTRDRVSAQGEWRGRPYTLIDTGGIGLLKGEKGADVITAAALHQVDLAVEAAEVIVLVVNVQEGVVPLDLEVATRLRATRKPVLLAVNKADSPRFTDASGEFSALGFDRIFPVTAIHGRGIEDLVQTAVDLLPPHEETAAGDAEGAAQPAVRLAIVGRPNVGKSSIINALTGSDRVIVSDIPGTTRDAVDVPFEVDTEGVRQRYVLVDTAGLRKARRVDDTVEYFSTQRTGEAIARSDITVLVMDAESGITEQDKKIADLITSNRRACILVVNKWDLVSEAVREARRAEVESRQDKDRPHDVRRGRPTTLSEFGEWVQSKLFFLDYAPVIFTSAADGFQLDRLLEAIRYVAAQLRQRVPTAILNRTLQDAIERRQPVSPLGHRLKFFYATQVQVAPPTFLLFVSRDDLFSPQYEKYLAGELRKAFGYEGCPMVLVPKPRPKTIEPVRKHAAARARQAKSGRTGARSGTRAGGREHAGSGKGGPAKGTPGRPPAGKVSAGRAVAARRKAGASTSRPPRKGGGTRPAQRGPRATRR